LDEDSTHAARVARYGSVSTALALLSDRRLSELVDAAPVLRSGIGGTAVSLDVAGWPVFVKRVPLTDLERSAVRERLTAIARASASLVLFLEHLPHGLRDWLAAQVAAGAGQAEAACAMVERDLSAVVSAMNTNGLVHFDAHFGNILTDGERLYLADLGLATSPRFDLSTVEREFLRANASHDASHTMTLLVNWLVAALAGITRIKDRNEYISRCATGDRPANLPEWAAAVVGRYAPVAVVMNDFYWKLFGESRATPYPAA
jgi:hypothetical protein